ncbi:hypothetical protein BV898_05146 [Hypsibius exemplaris]|uniref:Cilia- and flagella-associated protein 126 n=1 Tax=Hypsibius exemplaris TaxID=2072580 RepID=A0A1W0X010_HYPEX|nr:hypothetical protein BV898_05146 [Hypsibius exemplaris]
MSINFSANQYESAFKANNLNVWETGRGKLREDDLCENRPKARVGFTTPFCDLNGRFTDPTRRGSKESAWMKFKGTWNLPRQLPLHPRLLNPTARRPEQAEKNKRGYEEAVIRI